MSRDPLSPVEPSCTLRHGQASRGSRTLPSSAGGFCLCLCNSLGFGCGVQSGLGTSTDSQR